jgi:hypothetical protein
MAFVIFAEIVLFEQYVRTTFFKRFAKLMLSRNNS